MTIGFANKALEELYLHGKTNDREYHKLSKNVIKSYIKVVNYIKQPIALRICIASNHSITRRKKETFAEWMPFGLMTNTDYCSKVHQTKETLLLMRYY